MLKKAQRLNRSAFSSYFEKGRRTHGTYLTCVYTPAPAFFTAVVVGKKVSKKAVVRNRVRRRVYGLIEKKITQKPVLGVYIFITKPACATLSRAEFLEKVGDEIGRVIK